MPEDQDERSAQRLKAVIRADEADAFVRTVSRRGAKQAREDYHVPESEREQDTSLSETPTRDPRRFGKQGAYPRVANGHGQPEERLVWRLFREVGVFANIVDEWMSKVWSDGWILDTENDAWVEQAEQVDQELKIKRWLRRADERQFIFPKGFSLLHFALEEEGGVDPKQPPEAVTSVAEVNVVNPTMVTDWEVEDTDEDDDRFGEVVEWEISFGTGGDTELHPDRILHAREFPEDEDDVEGTPFMARVWDSTLGYENTFWAVIEAHFQRAAPYLVAEIDPDVQLNESDADDIMDKVDQIQNGTIQKIVAEQFELKPLEGSSRLANGMTPWQIAKDKISADSRVPKHILFGSAAGELSSSTEDTSRWHKRVSDRREEHAADMVRDWYALAATWGLIEDVPDDLTIEWPPLSEPSFDEQMDAEKKRGETIRQYTQAGALPPEKVVDYEAAEIPTPATATPEPAPAPEPAPDPESETDAHHHHESVPLLASTVVPWHDTLLTIPVWDLDAVQDQGELEVPELRPIRRRYESQLQDVFVNWMEDYLDLFREDERVGPEQGTGSEWALFDVEDPDDPLVQGLLNHEPDTTRIENLLFELLQESGEVGGLQTWEQIGQQGIFELVENDLKVFQTVAETVGSSQAEQATRRIRNEIAEAITENETFAEMRNRVTSTFDEAFDAQKAEMIARTESMRGYNHGARSALRQAGQDQFRFQAFDGACPICAPLDNQTFTLDSSGNVPPMHPRCRCTITMVVDQ